MSAGEGSGLALLTRCPRFHEEPSHPGVPLPHERSAAARRSSWPRAPFAWRPPLHRSDLSGGEVVVLCQGWASRTAAHGGPGSRPWRSCRWSERRRGCRCVFLRASFPRFVVWVVGRWIRAVENCDPPPTTNPHGWSRCRIQDLGFALWQWPKSAR